VSDCEGAEDDGLIERANVLSPNANNVATPALGSGPDIQASDPKYPWSQKLGAATELLPSGSRLTTGRASLEALRGRWSPRARRS
jgi:hypothetical protein